MGTEEKLAKLEKEFNQFRNTIKTLLSAGVEHCRDYDEFRQLMSDIYDIIELQQKEGGNRNAR